MMMPYNFKAMEKMLKDKIDNGETGVAAKKGFYDYSKYTLIKEPVYSPSSREITGSYFNLKLSSAREG